MHNRLYGAESTKLLAKKYAVILSALTGSLILPLSCLFSPAFRVLQQSDVYRVALGIDRTTLQRVSVSKNHTLLGVQGTGEASRDVLRNALAAHGVEFIPTTPEQTMITLMRAAGGDSTSAPYEAFLRKIEELGSFQHGL